MHSFFHSMSFSLSWEANILSTIQEIQDFYEILRLITKPLLLTLSWSKPLSFQSKQTTTIWLLSIITRTQWPSKFTRCLLRAYV